MTELGTMGICIIVVGVLLVLIGALGLCRAADKADRKLGYK